MENSEKEIDVDLDDVRKKYREERDKRLGHGGRDFQELVGDLSRYLDDPYTSPVQRAPVDDEVDVVCLGAGMSGLSVAAMMKKNGFSRVRVIDTAGDVGGVWYWNRYPECKCDIDSMIYMPFLEETGYIPTMHYASAPEIYEHTKRIARHFGLYEDALFQTTITSLVWDEGLERWHISTDRGDRIRAQFVAVCNGILSQVKLPDIPGIETFKGKSFHTARWDYDYTGGGPENPHLDRLKDKRVGFVGTGATALQCIPPLGHSAKHLYLLQRTPSTVGIRNNRPVNSQAVARFEPGWQKRWRENFTKINFGAPVEEDLIGDGWTDLFSELLASPRYKGLSGEALQLEMDRVDFEKMEKIRQRINSIVKDPDTAELLKPYYNYLCKRPGFHDEYLHAFNLPNVTLIDTQGAGIERVFEDGVVAGGQKYELDCLIFGTGFETEVTGRLRLLFEVTGKNGLSLMEKWKDGLATLHGLTTGGFPNLFLIPGFNSQAVVTPNVVHMILEYAEHIAFIAKAVRDGDADVFEVTKEAEDEWVRTIIDRRIDRTAFLEACTPGRNNYEGNITARPIQNTVFGGGPVEYFEILKTWRETGKLPGLELSKGGRVRQAHKPLVDDASSHRGRAVIDI